MIHAALFHFGQGDDARRGEFAALEFVVLHHGAERFGCFFFTHHQFQFLFVGGIGTFIIERNLIGVAFFEV